MALPQNYSSFENYLEDSLIFLKTYSWIYNSPNTHLLSNKILQETSSDWIEYFKQISTAGLNKLATGETEENAPKSLKQFFQKVKSFNPTFKRYTNEVSVNFPKNAQIAPKKKHEIVSLIPLIDEVCQKTSCDAVIDIGCGLGYISEMLNQQFNYKIIGIEGCSKKVLLAEQYQKKFYSKRSSKKVEYFEHMVTDDSFSYMQQLFAEKLSTKGSVCIIGLHVCADLCVTVLDLFKKLDFVKAIAIMPCCYHRMSVCVGENSTESFAKFPCSQTFRKKYQVMNGGKFLKRTFMRIAAQRSNEVWKDLTKDEHELRGKNCLFRAIVQEIVAEENWRIRRLKRKSGLRMDESYNIKLAAQNLQETHQLLTQDGDVVDIETISEKIFGKWNIYKDDYILIEAIVVLQNTLQSICENILLLDRIEYLKDVGINGFVCKVTNDVISPRCFAIVATKE